MESNTITAERVLGATRNDDEPGTAAATCCLRCYDEVWSQVRSDPYTALPTHDVTLRSFFRGFRYRLLESGRRTVQSDQDILPHFDKLIRPNGICLSGVWEIHHATPYTGLFATRAKGLIIARASVALGETRQGRLRSFGLAGKVFASLDGASVLPSANFFVIDDNGGTGTRDFQDAVMTNEPPLSINRSSLGALPILLAITVAQRLADRHSERRQLYPLASAGLTDPNLARAPRFMELRGKPGLRFPAEDFRDGLRLSLERGGPIEFAISVRERTRTPFVPIGTIRFDDAVASASCDHRLHFAHPPWKPETARRGA